MVGDGFNTFTLNAAQWGDNFAYLIMLWWEPWGNFGIDFSDLENHDSAVVRLGHAFTFTRNEADPVGEPGPEQRIIRLSDATRLVEPGALSSGVTVNQFDLLLYAIHFGLKCNGVSLSIEYYFRWLRELKGTGSLPETSLFDHGFFVQSGFFPMPHTIELYGRGSYVTGPFGDGLEVGGGVNWYVQNRRNWRFTFDVVNLTTPPTSQDRTGLKVGGSGTLFRFQSWMNF